ncbi:TPA: hypothetical protein ACSJUJ_000101 [Legionella pneumophila]|uniref:hypothetical protein n=1 Tax=Legionella TaxID=445 RepID=UPI001020096B|nr:MULTISPECIES: hypothetical protein [Legionella]MCO1453689.1 hypothetical protein [Legionella pneumophila]MDI0458128.1 hypothetical protein [Legionella pneumophila]MDI0462701.1 hypothetical protein [Legionella pneumophila]MDI2025494.1 hypothetical protein [Legionella pneumophila]MDI2082779.1 hypothetical protein [Legionella pneumophila]
MDMLINQDELAAMSGLPHIQQLAYLRGIRPYMDVKTGITGIKRRISYQSISEQLYIEPHQGIKSQSFSRDQVRRAVSGLVRAGMIEVQSDGMQLILKCPLASRHYSAQNKAAINPPQKATIKPHGETLVHNEFSEGEAIKADIAEPQKAATPLKDNNYIYLLSRFEQFWNLYPEKKSHERAFEAFRQISPDEHLLRMMLQALENQIKARNVKIAHGEWVPPWKYPSNWLVQKCWEDEVKIEVTQEKRNAKRRPNTELTTVDPFWNPEGEDTASTSEDEYEQSNVINLRCYRQK